MILTCPGCAARFVIPRSEDELRAVEVTHPACGHAFAPFAEPAGETVEAAPAEPPIEAPALVDEPMALATEELLPEEELPAPIALEEPLARIEACADDEDEHEDETPAPIDTHSLRKELTQATTIPFRHIIPKLAAAGFAAAAAAAAELVFLFNHGVDSAFPAAHYTLALLGMGS